MIEESHCVGTFRGPTGHVRVRIDIDVIVVAQGKYPDVNGLMDAMRTSGEQFMYEDEGDK